MTRARRISALAALLLAGGVLAPVTAEAFTHIGPHYYDWSLKNCTNVVACEITGFTAVPAGKTVVITRISCQILYSKGPSPAKLTFYKQANQSWAQYAHSVEKLSETALSAVYQSSSEVLIPMTAGQKLAVLLSLNGPATDIKINCSATGSMS